MTRQRIWIGKLAFLALAGAPTLLMAQTPHITSLQSGLFSATNGAAITAGTSASAIQLFINGTFEDSLVVDWTENGVTTPLAILSAGSNQIVANVPQSLYASSGAAVITVVQTSNTTHVTKTSGGSTFVINHSLAPAGTLPPGILGISYLQTFFTGGTGPFTLQTPSLPPGLTPTSATGNPLVGTPSQVGTFTFTPTITDAWGNVLTLNQSLTVVSRLAITTTSLPAGAIQQQYNTTVSASGGTGTYTWSATGLPSGLSIAPSTGVISGVPTTSGAFSVTVSVSDTGSQSAQAIYSLQITSPFSITTTSLPAGAVQQFYSTTVSATGGSTPYTWSATGLPAGLTIAASTGVISGTPTASGAFSVTVDASDSAAHTAQAIYSLQISSSFTITTASLPAGGFRQSYSATVSATGGTAPYTWSATGLPAGLAIAASTGVISGTPTTSGAFSVTVDASDSGGQTAQAIYPLQINSLLTVTTPSLPGGIIQQAYSATLTATGGGAPYSWSATGLPSGLTIAPTTGIISGTPTVTGTFPVTVTVTDSDSQTAHANYSLAISSLLTITTSSLPAGTILQSYSATVAATGGTTPYTWSASGLPSGLSIAPSTGTISGTPTISGTFPVTVMVSDSGGQTAQANYSLVLVSLLTITTGSLPSGAIHQAYSTTVSATGGVTPYTWSATGLPAGLSIAPGAGVISGTPTTSGAFSVTVTVSDSSQQSAQAIYSFQISSPFTITTPSLPNGRIQQAYSATVAATGGTTPFTWSASGLPSGLSIAPNTGVISGTPATSGTFSVTVTVSDANQQSTQAIYSLQITSSFTITTSSLPVGRSQHAYSATVSATGGVTPYTWSATGLPAGLSIAPTTGVISGTPTTPGSFSVTVTASDSSQQTTQAIYTLQINSLLTIMTSSLPTGRIQQPYSVTVSATGGVTPYTWSATGLPAGLSIAPSTGSISGTPTTSGSFSVTVTVSDSSQQTTQATYPLQINALLTITTGSLPAGRIQQAYNTTVFATGGVTPYAWSATGLPAGLSISPSTGAISGTPTTTGTFSVAVTVTDSSQQTAHATYSLSINTLLTITTTSLPAGRAQQSYSATVAAIGGVTPYTWSATGLPPGLNIAAGTGVISGAPTSSGASSVTVFVSDSSGQSTQASYTLQVNSLFTITTLSLPAGTIRQSYSATVAATGGTTPYTWSATGLPTGLAIAVDTGVISGTPNSSGTYSVTVFVSDSASQATQAIYTLQITSTFTITTATLPAGTLVQPYTATVSATGGTTPYTWSASGLPQGLSIAAGTGVISGTPAPSGAYSVTVAVSDSSQQTTQTIYTLQINSGFTITTGALPPGSLQQPYSTTVSVSGGTAPYTWSASGLPVGLSIASGTGVISGTPATSGTYSVTVSVFDFNDQTTQAIYTLPINSLFTVTTNFLPSGSIQQPYVASVSATGGVAPYTWSASGLPPGLSINIGTGVISGTPTAAGTFPVAVSITDSVGQTTQGLYSLSIAGGSVIPPPQAPPLQITTQSLPAGAVGQIYATLIGASGGTGNYVFNVIGGSLPLNVQLALAGQLYGTPKVPGTSTFTVQVTDSAQSTATQILTITIAPGPVTVTGTAPPNVGVNTPLTVVVSASGGVGPYVYTLSGTAPPGTSFSNGTLSGTPSTPGTYTFTVTAIDSQSPPGTSSQTFTITVTPAPLVITGTLPNGQMGQPYAATLTATGGVGPYTWSGTAGSGLTVASNGTVTGTPTASGSLSISVTVTDSTGTKTTSTYTVTIAPGPLVVSTTSLPDGQLTVAYSFGLNAGGGTPPYTWSAVGLPDGLTVSVIGSIGGTPNTMGAFAVTATVKDSIGATASKTLSLTINPAPLTITTTSISAPPLGTPFSASFGATGGTLPYSWTATGLPPGVTLASNGTLSGASTQLGTFAATVTVTDANKQTASEIINFAINLPTAPSVSFSGLPANGTPGSQPTTSVTFSAPYPVDVTVQLTLTFAPAAGADDPNIQFSSGGRTASVTIPAGATTSLTTVGVQTGTVAGVITITAQLIAANGADITPSPAPTRNISIAPAAPTISAVTAATTSTGFTVTISGFDPTRAVTQATFTFAPAAGSNLQTTTVTLPVQTLFTAWYQNPASAQYGSQFSFTIPFTVSGNVSGITSVTVTLTNATGTSGASTATL